MRTISSFPSITSVVVHVAQFIERFLQPGTYLNHNMDEISYSDFISRELILFSVTDNVCSVPSVVDGLKPGQRTGRALNES